VIAAILATRRSFFVQDPFVEGLGLFAVAIFYGGFVAAAILADGSGSRFERLLSGRVLGAFGRYSYGLYLVHLPLRAVLRDVVLTPARFAAFPGGPVAAQLAFYAAAIALSFAVAAASYHLFEARFLRMKDVVAGGRAEAAPA
jgi:peptidoglycan/LPS O-acetylase OafA/YrhL